MYKTINLCGRGGRCCPKLTIPVIEGKKYGLKDLFFLSDDYGNECRYAYTELSELASSVLAKAKGNITHEIRDNHGNECLLSSEECGYLLTTIKKL